MSAEFDSYSDNYSEALKAGLAITGESQEYYATERVKITALRVRQAGARIGRILDFGCGQGSSTPLLRSTLGATEAVGAEVSQGLLDVARAQNADPRVKYVEVEHIRDCESFDCAYMNGVLHHIRPEGQLDTIKLIRDCLAPGGLFAFWENNPWNPGTRYVMSKIPFDRDATMLSIPETRAMLRAAGFEPLTTDTAFFFPRALSALRGLDRFLSPTRLGGQYLIVARAPGGAA